MPEFDIEMECRSSATVRVSADSPEEAVRFATQRFKRLSQIASQKPGIVRPAKDAQLIATSVTSVGPGDVAPSVDLAVLGRCESCEIGLLDVDEPTHVSTEGGSFCAECAAGLPGDPEAPPLADSH